MCCEMGEFGEIPLATSILMGPYGTAIAEGFHRGDLNQVEDNHNDHLFIVEVSTKPRTAVVDICPV